MKGEVDRSQDRRFEVLAKVSRLAAGERDVPRPLRDGISGGVIRDGRLRRIAGEEAPPAVQRRGGIDDPV